MPPLASTGSANMHRIAEEVLHAWTPADGLLDFTKVFSDGEYAHKYYAGRRMWGAYRLLSPSHVLPDTYTDLKFEQIYPTVMKPDHKLSKGDVFAVHRSYYEGASDPTSRCLCLRLCRSPQLL
jgi:dipeptidase